MEVVMMTETIEVPQQAFQELVETVKQQGEAIEELEEENRDLREEMAAHKDHTGREFADVRARISDVEDDLESGEGPSSEDESGIEDDGTGPQTPLERICGYNQAQAFRELTANQERAWFLAKDIKRHAEKAPAGYVLDTKTIKNVIGGHEDKELHDNNADRIKRFLNEFGQDTVRVKERHGKKLVVIDKEAGKRMVEHHHRCEAMDGPPTPGNVIPA